ncbi:MAG TPA: hypothetical protein VG432_05520, partial [Gemmatimonadaceae bacterium]|nr:hypothetical protein [Gemmatimonadaceae bacterium]
MSEQVYRVVQYGVETTVGTSVPATAKLAVDAATPELDRGSAFGAEDYGRSIRNHAGRGYHGLRGAQMPFAGDVTFEQIMVFLEAHYQGGVTPTGTDPYTWVYALEGGAATRKTLTIEEGVPSSTQDEWEMAGCVVDELTLEYDALAAPGAQPWRMSGTLLGLNRTVATLTASLTLPALETVMGHLTILKEGTTATAFASLTEIAASLVRFSVTTSRSNVRRAYGSTSDVATGWGQSEKATGTFEAMLKISATTKSNVLDIWNASGGSLGERRWRIAAAGSGTKTLTLDFRTGFTNVGIDDRDGERVYAVSGELVDDDTLAAP